MHAVMFNKHLMSSKNYKLAVVCFAHRLQQSLLKGFYPFTRVFMDSKVSKKVLFYIQISFFNITDYISLFSR